MDKRCAIAITVLPFFKVLIDLCIAASVSLSTAEVASSKINISGFFSIALAIEILCFSPPDKRIPFSPIIVSYF